MINALVTYLLGHNQTTGKAANLLDADSNPVALYHQRIRQGNSKYGVVYNVLSDTPDYVKGAMALRRYPVSFSIYAETDTRAANIADNLITLLEGWQGTHGGKVWHYTTLERVVEGFGDTMEMPNRVVDFIFQRHN